MNFVAYHRPLIHLKQFRGLEEYMGKSVDWNPRDIKLKQNKGDSNQDYEKIYARALTLWKDRKPVEFIRKSLKLDDSQPLFSHSYQHSPQSQHSPILSSPINSHALSTATSIHLSHSGLLTQLPSFRPRLIRNPNSVTTHSQLPPFRFRLVHLSPGTPT